MLPDAVSALIRSTGSPCFQVYGKATSEADWHRIDVFATRRRDVSSRLPLWRGTCITWTSRVIAVGRDFAAAVLREQRCEPASREYPMAVAGGRLRRGRPFGSGPASASEVLAHEIGHTAQARRLGPLYWPAVGAVTLFREGPHWWNHFENEASATGLFGGIVSGSLNADLMREMDQGPET
jgi:hypothetical protein